MLDDGSAGLVVVRRAGGLAVVQDPAEALFRDMLQNAIDTAGADYCVAISEMAPLLDRLVREIRRRLQRVRAGAGLAVGGHAALPVAII